MAWNEIRKHHNAPAPAGSALPHAVSRLTVTDTATGTTVANTTFAYDADGNLTAGGGKSVTWYADNHPYQIQANGAMETFSYSPDGNRYLRVDTTPQGTTVTTVYIDGLLEVRYDSGSSVNEAVSYVLTDHLESVDDVQGSTSAARPLAVPGGGGGRKPGATNVGLIHMNGWVYDPLIG